MGILDAINSEDRIQVKFSDFYAMMKGCTQRDQMMNSIKCDVPHRYIREMMTGKSEKDSAPGLKTVNECEIVRNLQDECDQWKQLENAIDKACEILVDTARQSGKCIPVCPAKSRDSCILECEDKDAWKAYFLGDDKQ